MSVYYGTKEGIATDVYNSLVSLYAAARVERQYMEQGNYSYPAVFMNDMTEERTRYLKDVVLVKWTLALILFVYDEGSTLSTTLNTEIAKVCDKLNNDPTRGGIAYNTKILRVDTAEGFKIPHGVAIVSVEILYLSQK